MSDYLFDELLNRRGNVTRPVVEVGGERLAREPRYAAVGLAVPLRVRPARTGLDQGLLGRWPQAAVVLYLRPGLVRALDRVGVVRAATELAEAAEEGARAIVVASTEGLESGARLHVRTSQALAEVVVESVEGRVVALREALEEAWEAGAAVEVVESYEVLGVEEAGGEGHHVRAAGRRR